MPGIRAALAALAAAAAFAHVASAATVWDEAVNGDLSSTRTTPTLIALSPGTNLIHGTTIQGDIDFFTVTVPEGAFLSQLILGLFSSQDDLAFLAIQSGPIITSTASAAALLGWVHPSILLERTDILDNMAAGAGALGFTPPLPAGTYALWMQQTNANLVTYRFNLVLVPEPAAAALLGFGLGALAIARPRRA